jgi:hypothetical protein
MQIKEVLTESSILDKKEHINKFLAHCKEQLGLDSLPPINLITSKDYSVTHKSFGGYDPEEKRIILAINGRHIMDVMRTLAHELTHYKQDLNGQLHDEAGATGSDEENEANAMAGIIMRHFGRANPELF